MSFPGIENLQSADELEAALRRIGDERYHNRHPFHRLLHGGRLSRGSAYVVNQDTVTSARFEPRRPVMRSAGEWGWNENPFRGTKHLSGLKVLMILLNNYDARSSNNEIFIVGGRRSGR